MKPLTVLHINTEPAWRGGEAQTLMLAGGLRDRGHRSLLVAQRGSQMAARGLAAGLAVHPLSMKGEFDPGAVLGIARVLRDEPVDMLHYHTSHAVTLGSLATLVAGRRPAVLTRRVSFSLRRNPFAKFKYTWRVDHLIAVADSVRWVMIAEGIAPDRVSVVHSGIDLARFPGRRDRDALAGEFGIDPGALLVGCVGHLAPHKGHAFLIEALAGVAAELPGMSLLIVGEGPERRRLEALAASGPLAGRVIFAGFREDVPRIMASFDLYAMASLSGEGSPAVVKEAMASGVPVIAADLDGIREIAEDGREALLVAPGDPLRFGQAVVRAASSPAMRRSLAATGLERVREFSSDRMVDRTIEVYSKVLHRYRMRE